MLITALFVITEKWKQLKCPSTDEGRNKLWQIHIMKYYPIIRKNKDLVCIIYKEPLQLNNRKINK